MGSVFDLVARDGYAAVAIAIGLESIGVPIPGETMLITAAIYAGRTHQLNIAFVIIWACVGAIVGDNVGFAIGRRFGYPLLLRYGSLLKISPARIKLGVFLFRRHGGKVVFLGRFVAVLRALAALLAGLNCMPWGRFLFFNAAGAIVWTTGYGIGAYWFGKEIERFSTPAAGFLVVIAAVFAVTILVFVRRHEAELEAEAEREMPGPLPPNRRR